MTKDVLKTILRTFVAFVIIAVFVMLGIYVVSPKTMASICGSLGLTKFEVNCLELEYTRNKTNSNLYNLIVKQAEIEEYADQISNIEKLQNSDTYSEFCASMDASIEENYKNNNLTAKAFSLLYGTNEYLNSATIIGLLKQGKHEEAYLSCMEMTNEDSLYEVSAYYYVDYLMSKDIDSNVCKNYCARLNTDGIYASLQNKLNLLTSDTQVGTKSIINSYSKVKASYAIYVISSQIEDGNQTNSYNTWQNWLKEYKDLIK